MQFGGNFGTVTTRVSLAASFFAHALHEAGNVDYGPPHCAASNLLRAVVGPDAHGIEAAVKRFQFRLGANSHSDSAGCAVFDVDGNADRDFSLITEWL